MDGMIKKYVAELVGTAVLVLVGCGAVAMGDYGPSLAVAAVPIGFAFGLTLMGMVYLIGPISGCHINPAVTVAMVAAGRMQPRDALGYIISQLVGAIAGALILVIVVKGRDTGYDVAALGLGQNGWGSYGILSAILVEIIATFIFTAVVLGATQEVHGTGRPAGLIIGLTLFALHLPFIMVTGLSVNPARSLGPAVFVGGTALTQLWLFLVMPLVGGAIAGWLFRIKILSAD